jgi:hypothetical protein
VFDNLPGAGKPLDLKPGTDADYGQAWTRDYARREGVAPEEFLPTPLRLRREIERLADSIGDMRSEQDVREIVGDLNRRILEFRRIPDGPPVFVPLVHMDEMVDRWRAAQAARRAPAPEPDEAARAEPSAPAARRAPPRRWLRRRPAKRPHRA